uniref:Uncharacterized protein n=1 Tax=Trypanosoma brucei TaxID=5691 RepID=Q581M9_9TRYP|nr:hypothetical protein, unlikely [Trypanosoma brucei]
MRIPTAGRTTQNTTQMHTRICVCVKEQIFFYFKREREGGGNIQTISEFVPTLQVPPVCVPYAAESYLRTTVLSSHKDLEKRTAGKEESASLVFPCKAKEKKTGKKTTTSKHKRRENVMRPQTAKRKGGLRTTVK